MKKSPRLAPILVALSVLLSAAPQAALAQVAMRPVIGPAASATGASAVTALPALSPLAALNAAAAPINPVFSAPALAPAPTLAAAPAVMIRTPGAAATGVADEAAAYAGDPAVGAPVVRKGLAGRLADVVLGRASLSALFDATVSRGETPAPIFGRLGIQEHKPILLPNGSRPDAQPTTPSPDREPTVLLQTYSLPGARDVGGALEPRRKVLNADPNDVASVVNALKAAVNADPTRYGVSGAELRLIGARKFDGHGEQADTLFVHFRQVKDNLVVNGANLSFTLKVLDGKPVIVAQTGQLFPRIDVDTQATLTEGQIMGKIAERIGMPVAAVTDAFQFSEEKIIYSRGSWRHVKLYVADELPFMIAVDLASGLVFAWDNRTGFRQGHAAKKNKDAGVGGTIAGKAVDHGPILPDAQLKNLPLAFLNLTIGDKTYTTDKEGKFATDGLEIPSEGLTLTATLSGPFVTLEDTTGKTLTISVTLKPGDGTVSAVFNPDSTINDESQIAQVSAFHKVNLAYTFLRERKLTTEQMDKNPILVRMNVDTGGNAYYTPGSPSLNFEPSNADFVNSAYDTVADHEYGHYWDDMTGGIMNGGLSEGWGDTLSMYLLNNPIIGEHFMKTPRPDGKDYIRHGENLYQYNEFDEVHAQGQAWQGFTWKLRAALMKELGDAAGAALAEALVLPTMFAKAATIPDAIAQVLVNAMKKDGTIQYEETIRSTAKIHGITLPQNPGKGFLAALAPSSWKSVTVAERNRPSNGTGSVVFNVGRLLDADVPGYVEKYLQHFDVQFKLVKIGGGLSGASYALTMKGSAKAIENITKKLKDGRFNHF